MKYIGKDYLDGATKVKTIMGKTFYRCRICGEPFQYHREANNHCKSAKKAQNQSGQITQKWRNE
jgi:uncharacterized C2H2 Zn-finger protein